MRVSIGDRASSAHLSADEVGHTGRAPATEGETARLLLSSQCQQAKLSEYDKRRPLRHHTSAPEN